MNKRIIVIGAIVIVVIAVGAVLYFTQNNPSGTTTTTSSGTLPPVSTSTTPIALPPAPTGTTLIIGTSEGGVKMNNFYQTAQTSTQDGEAVLLQNTADYAITYNVPDSSFSIALLSTPLEAARQAAESAFLSSLGISQADACKLKVYEGVPIGVSDEYPGESFPLSFCGGPTTL